MMKKGNSRRTEIHSSNDFSLEHFIPSSLQMLYMDSWEKKRQDKMD